MQIPSAIASGINGFNSAQNSLAQATVDVARPEVPAEQAALQSPPVDKTEALIQATQAVTQAEASAEVIDRADETLGTIIDISV
ncbi:MULTISPECIES: chemotaxis protein [Shewanella]|uniref:Chemotaxis protein n=2 Tax=Shewanella TaxID=22 RepID=A0A975AM95_9GAMM|nr:MULTISPECIES: chemotaxis protein [Shewanella]QSX31606.1 chemotaxis protein [Shewanella cyperi]QSX38829.1 chemotaxis protein [Shewanella sedimentimangrovi]QSX42385.1 chemotaxis protein [Shewanella cyperi]